MSKKTLFISNGHGEDLVAAEIIKNLKAKNFSAESLVLPIVGEGKIFESLGVKILGARKKLPGGGFSLRHLSWLLQDLGSGILGHTWKNLGILRKLKGKLALVIGIGDLVPIIGAILTKAPFIFIGVNKSDYYKTFGYNYTPWERWLLKRYARLVFARDQITADNLKKQGIKAEYAGNPLMDCIGENPKSQISEESEDSRSPSDPNPNKEKIIIGLLPGTREDVGLNLEDFARLKTEIENLKPRDKTVEFLTASQNEKAINPRPFAEVINKADIIIGLSGTGNEQAAGYGKPIVSFYGRGSQYTKKFALAQKELLGEALCLVDINLRIVALTVWNILQDQEIYQKMSRAGKERMGSAGACKKICDRINT